MRRTANGEYGFTLVELAIALVIIALLLTATLKGQSLIQAAKIDSVVGMTKDIGAAARVFKERYHFLPGDFPAATEISGLSAACRRVSASGPSSGPNGDGRISAAESACVPEHLIRAGLLTGDPTAQLMTDFGSVRLVQWADSETRAAREAAGLAMPSPLPIHVIEFANLPCEVAQGVDTRLDDGNLDSGVVRASAAACLSGIMSFMAIVL